jgi:lysophospholipase L1-like esterase
MFRFLPSILASLIAFISVEPAGYADTNSVFQPGKRIVFLGDSITAAGGFIVGLETHFQSMENPPQFINLGLPSETCSGLSEKSHPFPRPNIHERLDRALDRLQPDVVVACYGMNCAIFHPISDAGYQKYKDGIDLLIQKCKASGATVVLITPPPFDPVPLSRLGKLNEADADDFSWNTPYQHYNDVMRAYADYVLSKRDEVDDVIDVFQPLTGYVDVKRQSDPNFAMSADGVHLNDEGHQVMADAILKHLGETPTKPDETLFQLIRQRQAIFHDTYLSLVGHQRPGMPEGLPLEEAIKATEKISEQIRNRAALLDADTSAAP